MGLGMMGSRGLSAWVISEGPGPTEDPVSFQGSSEQPRTAEEGALKAEASKGSRWISHLSRQVIPLLLGGEGAERPCSIKDRIPLPTATPHPFCASSLRMAAFAGLAKVGRGRQLSQLGAPRL